MQLVYSSLKNILIVQLVDDNKTVSSLGKKKTKPYAIKAMTENFK